jgi:hypothetical protein
VLGREASRHFRNKKLMSFKQCKNKNRNRNIVLYLLRVPAHPYKTEAIGYRTCHTTNLPLDTELVTQQTCSNQQVVIKAMHINAVTIDQTYRTTYTSLYLCNIYNGYKT